MNGVWTLFRRDLALAFRIGGGGGVGVAFFALAVTLIPLGVGADPPVLGRIAGGVIWVAALLASLLSLDRLFQADFEDGSLDQILLGPAPAEAVALAKAAAHWATTGLPLTVAAPVLGLMLSLPTGALGALVASLLIGAPALSLIGAVGAALTVGVRRGGLLLSIIVLPLYVPTLIFGALAVGAAGRGDPAGTPLLLLGAVTLGALAVCPFAAAAALRVNAR